VSEKKDNDSRDLPGDATTQQPHRGRGRPGRSGPPGNGNAATHRLYALEAALATVEKRDDGTWLEGPAGQALREWRAAIVADLGGEDAISAQERAVIDAATTTYLLLSSVDRFLLEQPSIVNKSRRQLFPVVLERQRLADALVRYLDTLGLRRRVREAPDVAAYLASRTNEAGRADGEDTDQRDRTDRTPVGSTTSEGS
jgi:hypothetical protein